MWCSAPVLRKPGFEARRGDLARASAPRNLFEHAGSDEVALRVACRHRPSRQGGQQGSGSLVMMTGERVVDRALAAATLAAGDSPLTERYWTRSRSQNQESKVSTSGTHDCRKVVSLAVEKR